MLRFVLCPSSLCTMNSLLEALFSPLPLPAIISLFALAAATLFYLNTRPSPMRSPVDLNSQSLGIKVKSAELSVFYNFWCRWRPNVASWFSCCFCRMERGRRRCSRTTTTCCRITTRTPRPSTRSSRGVWGFQVTQTVFLYINDATGLLSNRPVKDRGLGYEFSLCVAGERHEDSDVSDELKFWF